MQDYKLPQCKNKTRQTTANGIKDYGGLCGLKAPVSRLQTCNLYLLYENEHFNVHDSLLSVFT